MTFYLGAPDPTWIGVSGRPLMVSHNRLRRIKTMSGMPVADPRYPWILDSGGYDVITRYGGYPDNAEAYVRAVRRYDMTIGALRWASIQDFPCEREALAKTGLAVLDHQLLSVQSYLDLTTWWSRLAPRRPCPFRPVVQGDTADSYLRHWCMYGDRGVDLSTIDIIAVGSICRREKSAEIIDIATALRERATGILHGFGVKDDAVALFDDVDSMAWSKAARVRAEKDPECTQFHRVCNSCLVYAEHWHDSMLARHGAVRRVSHPVLGRD